MTVAVNEKLREKLVQTYVDNLELAEAYQVLQDNQKIVPESPQAKFLH
jgi:hypothetical protein